MPMQNNPSEPTGFRIVYFTPSDLGMASLVGINGELPVSFGNYFSFLNPDNREDKPIERLNGPRVVNMWYENFKHLFKEFGLEKVRALVFGSAPDWVAVIEDDRVPANYLVPYLYCVGHSSRYLEAVQAYTKLPVKC